MTTTATIRRNANLNWFKSQSNAETVEYLGHLFIGYVTDKGESAVAYFGPKSEKPQAHIVFRTIEKMVDYMVRVAKNIDSRFKEKKARTAKAKIESEAIKVGDILNTSWGYEQTNVEFYQVIEKKGITVTLQELGQFYVKEGNMCGDVLPDLESRKGEPFKKRLSGGYANINSSARAYKWNGKPCYTSSYY